MFCGCDSKACILYGLANFSESLQQDLENGFIIGGCTIFEGDPKIQIFTIINAGTFAISCNLQISDVSPIF